MTYLFRLIIDEAEESMDYICDACGRREHGGGIPNPGLYSRMKAHLRESHAVLDPENWQVLHEETGPTSANITISRKPENSAGA